MHFQKVSLSAALRWALFTPAIHHPLLIYYVVCDHSPAVEVAGSLSHVNTKTVSCQRFCGRDKLIASLVQERAVSSRGSWREFSHVCVWGEGERCLMDLGFISRRLSCSFIVNPSNPEKASAQRFTFFTLQKHEYANTHKRCATQHWRGGYNKNK